MSLTKPQAALLAEIRDTVNSYGQRGLYIGRYGRYGRTVEALHRRGLVRCDEHDHSSFGQDHWVAT